MPGPIYIAPTAAGTPDVPYLTTDEYINDPDSLDISNLVPGGTTQQNIDVLYTKILQASSWMDGYCHYALGATINTEVQRCRVRVDGTIHFATRGFPILEVISIKIGRWPSQLAAIVATSQSDIYAEENLLIIPAIVSPFSLSAFGPGDKVYVQVTYVNGGANTLLANAPALGANQVIVKSALGIYAGTTLTVYDLAKTEVLTVASSYVGGVGQSSTTIPIVGVTSFAHALGISISSLPAQVKKAAILATSAHIKTRGGGALVMDQINSENPGKIEVGEAGAMQDLILAMDMLKSYRNMLFA